MKDNFNFIKNQTKEEGREIFSAIKKLEEYQDKEQYCVVIFNIMFNAAYCAAVIKEQEKY